MSPGAAESARSAPAAVDKGAAATASAKKVSMRGKLFARSYTPIIEVTWRKMGTARVLEGKRMCVCETGKGCS